MASEADVEPTQTQSQSTEVDINSWKLNEKSDSEVWGKLHAMKDGIIDIGEANNYQSNHGHTFHNHFSPLKWPTVADRFDRQHIHSG